MLRGCDEADFARAGNHTEHGRMTLAELVTTYAGHLDHHLKFLYGKRANLGSALQPRYTYPDVVTLLAEFDWIHDRRLEA